MLLYEIDEIYKNLTGGNVWDYDGSQHKKEFETCLCLLNSKIREISDENIWFLEIGAFKGLWAIAFKKLCELNNRKPHYVTVTWLKHNPENLSLLKIKEYYLNNHLFFELVDDDSTKPETKIRVAKINSKFHFVFIDGDHAYTSVLKDIENYRELAADYLLFHDINTNTKDCGVRKAINKASIVLNVEISFSDVMGIGISSIRDNERTIKRRFLGWRK